MIFIFVSFELNHLILKRRKIKYYFCTVLVHSLIKWFYLHFIQTYIFSDTSSLS